MPHHYTPEQKEFISENIKGKTVKELTEMINEQFGINLGKNQIRAFVKNNGLKSGLDYSFKPGHVPVNKGTKGLYNVGGNCTSFKSGQPAFNYKPIGFERVDRDGYVLIKVQDDGPWNKRWRHKHVVTWEETNGPVPKGKCLLFLDGNRLNVSLDNLELITKGQLARLNQNHLISDDADLTRTGILIADVYQKIGIRKKDK